jgi:hypothetical protein
MKCDKHNRAMECMAGRSAHRSNWYCPECDKDKRITELTEERNSLRVLADEEHATAARIAAENTRLKGLLEQMRESTNYVEKIEKERDSLKEQIKVYNTRWI